ncbi:hypothetical protein NEUTE1DRAFT_54545 [Neurospora tetrasperma FGSC 2508]|uniref:Uncharacterized protein n=1 Tax=Neurospora tetrasperma (strain FGSC 2508 / ATCC MYA-4615 / P0657) TaxID=510951 RepID=F8N4R9_NEUT8|nr:uncharacterized protein NEUTE1DRAFT_54545 [Neurospora tetrasperma FGSC 2508]EGO51906.1 hypothetical protein NEUTE1DRAFT_54545 [Neurospora tetrasperma FGSC 2508]
MTTIPKPTSIRKNSNRNASHPSHLPPTPPTLHPLPASLLLSQDPRLSRLQTHDRNDFFSTGCRELDSHVLLNAGLNGGGGGGGLGGFEGGCVVGLSCEEEETIGLAIGLQVVARMLLMSSSSSSSSSSGSKAKAMIISTLSTTSLLPRLRLALVSEARVLQGNVGNAHHHQVDRGVIKSCLERVLVARVFDAEGLREVLRELEEVEQQQTVVSHSDGNEAGRGGGGETGEKRTEQSKEDGLLPDLIIITNTSHLLNTLFTRNKTGSDRSAAHNSAVQLSDQIRGLSRRGPLVMMLNSTTSPTSSSSSFNTNSISMFDDDNNNNKGPKQPDLSIMRSIFNPPPPPPPLASMEAAAPGYMGGLVGGHTAGAPSAASYRGGGYGGRGGGYGKNHSTHLHPHQAQTQSAAAAAAAVTAASRRNKPSYGMVFSQMLDLHLLCTKIPRGRTRHGGGAYGGGGYGGYGGGYVWAVEVLLDELGVYEGLDVVLDKVSREGGGGGGEEKEKEGQGEQQEGGRRKEGVREEKRKGKGLTRRSREQRWGAVEIEEGSGRVVDAFR